LVRASALLLVRASAQSLLRASAQGVFVAFRIELDKENFKFSASHFTIFGSQHAERLHGHNYYVSCEILLVDVDAALGMAFDFNSVKPLIRKITESLDEFVLIPVKSPFLQVNTSAGKVNVRFASKEYSLPLEDTRLLPIVNITSEELSRYIAEQLVQELKKTAVNLKLIQSLQVGVQESRGQTVFYEIEFI